MSGLYSIILAAGEGKRMKSKTPKVLHDICGASMAEWAMDAVAADGEKPVLIVGYGKEKVMEYFGDRVDYAVQEEQLGTGHAVNMAREFFENREGYVIVIAGDMPLVRRQSVQRLVNRVLEDGFDAGVLTARMDNPTGYGRIVRCADGTICRIVEEKDANEIQKRILEVNSSIYCFDIKMLFRCLKDLKNNNAQGEYYLTDCVEMMFLSGCKIAAVPVDDPTECMGVNDMAQLAEAARLLRARIIEKHQIEGVNIIDPRNTYIDKNVKIGRDTIIYPGNVIQGRTEIGDGCILYPNNRIRDSVIGPGAHVESSLVVEARVGANAAIGPFVQLRPGSDVGQNCRVGNFVEVKNSKLGENTKVSHLTYVGDADVGSGCNVGCGVVFVNYDGTKKYRTTIGDNVFIGCNTNLIAPVSVGSGAYIAAGSTITEDVPENTLAVARARQVIKNGWTMDRLRAKHKNTEEK